MPAILNTNHGEKKVAKRFYFVKQYLEVPDFEQVVHKKRNNSQAGTSMFQVRKKIKELRVDFLKKRGVHLLNSGKEIRELKGKMEAMQNAGGDRDWLPWKQL